MLLLWAHKEQINTFSATSSVYLCVCVCVSTCKTFDSVYKFFDIYQINKSQQAVEQFPTDSNVGCDGIMFLSLFGWSQLI